MPPRKPAQHQESSALWHDLPPEEKVKIWEDIVPGTAPELLKQVYKQARHRRRLAMLQEFRQWLPYLSAFGSVALFVWLAKYFVDNGAPIEGASVVGAGLATLVAAFLGTRVVSGRRAKSPLNAVDASAARASSSM